MDELLVAKDCPECHGVDTVILGFCSICFAEFDEWHDRDDAWTEAAGLVRRE
jgi:N-acyl-D-aspartate/D-glutamate deacylase